MVNLTGLKAFSRNTVETVTPEPNLPVKVELLDLGLTSFFEMEIDRNGMGDYEFSKERFVGESSARPRPYRVRFTGRGQPPFLKDFPE